MKNENWAKFNFQGVTPPEALGGTVRITPQASYGDGVKPALYELYLDGRRVMTAKPGESFEFDTTKVADGPHELSVISTGDDAIASQGRLAVPVVVRNGPDMLEVVGPPASEVPWDKPIELRAKLSAAGEIVLYHNVGLMRRIAGPEGSFQVDPRTLGQGPVRLQAVGVVAGRQVWGNPIDLTIVPPPALPAVQTPDEKGLTAGFRITVPDKPSVVADKIDAESLARAGLEKDRDFAVEAFFRVPEDDVYQFQVRGHANIRKMLVDGQAQDWPRGREWWFVPVHLAKGLHQLRIEGRAIDRPNLDIRFGGPGGRKLDAKRTPIWYCSP